MSNGTCGTISAIWRYPVKSMGGEVIAATHVTAHGVAGDRASALVDTHTHRAAVVRTWGARLLSYSARLVREPGPDETMPPPVEVSEPGGSLLSQSQIETALATTFGHSLKLLSHAPKGLLVEFPQGTLGGALAELTEAPLAGSAALGTFYDLAPLHLVTTATLDHLQAQTETLIDARRFRPNFVVQTATPLAENDWIGRNIAIGSEVILRITMPCPRCVNVVADQPGLERVPKLLRTIGKINTQDLGEFGMLPCIGVYAEVMRPGYVKHGDAVRVLG